MTWSDDTTTTDVLIIEGEETRNQGFLFWLKNLLHTDMESDNLIT